MRDFRRKDIGGERVHPEGCVVRKDKFVKITGPKSHKYIYAPTLEQLIEACGGRLSSLRRDEGLTVKWWTFCNMMPEGVYVSASTPTEAVARLFLALNKKTA